MIINKQHVWKLWKTENVIISFAFGIKKQNDSVVVIHLQLIPQVDVKLLGIEWFCRSVCHFMLTVNHTA